MAFKKKSKRKLPQSVAPTPKPATPMSVKAMVIENPDGNLYFERLKYKGCPAYVFQGAVGCKPELPNNEMLVDMQRDDSIRELYDIFNEYPANSTTRTRFRDLCAYVSALDGAQPPRQLDFSSANVRWYGQELERLVKLSKDQGGIAEGTAANKRLSLATILRSKGQHSLANQLPSFNGKNGRVPHKTLSDDDFVIAGKFLFRGYKGYIQHIQAGTTPDICPLFERERLVQLGLSRKQIGNASSGAKLRVSPRLGDWRNTAVSVAMMLTSMFTGINPTPMYKLRRRDVQFKKGAGDHYSLESVKDRAGAGGQKQENALGFTRLSKEFLERWLDATEQCEGWPSDPDDVVFPRFSGNGGVTLWGINARSPQELINPILVRHHLPKVTASIFRKTRSSQLMRVLNDVRAVADANNNEVATTSREYLHGVQDQHDLANAGAFEVQAKMAKGMDKKQALDEAVWKCKDPLTDLEYLKYKNKRPNKTKTGLGCDGPLADKVARQKREFRDVNPDLDVCIDFLGCFDCSQHALIAETDDIWMMLSFRDTLREVLERPAYNSVPSLRFSETESKVEVILGKLRAKAPEAYREAEKLNSEASHPLYDDCDAIDDLLRIYG